MGAAITSSPSGLLTYESYMTEGCVEGSYDIVEGVRVFMTAPTWDHQEIVGNIYDALRAYSKRSRNGKALMAPFDILIRSTPRLQTRQPDVFYISLKQLELGGGVPKRGPLEIAPELIVEVISDSETQRRVESKLDDYHEIGVQECWRVWSQTRSVEILQWTQNQFVVAAVFTDGQTVVSQIFPDLHVDVAVLFAE